jgi:hypothetical protein
VITLDGVQRDVDRKTWSTLAAHAALRGYQAWRSDGSDGPVRFFLGRRDMVRVCANLEELERVLDQVAATSPRERAA